MYYKPLKKSENSSIIEPAQVDEIFFQIPEILVNHEFFLEQLTNRVNNWTEKQIIGDIFVSSVSILLMLVLLSESTLAILGWFYLFKIDILSIFFHQPSVGRP